MTDQPNPADLEKAISLFRRFQGRAPRRGEIIEIGGPDGGLGRTIPVLLVGTAVSIGYKAIGDGKDYYHEFEGGRPKVFVNPDGRQAFLIGGEYQFTDRGFIK